MAELLLQVTRPLTTPIVRGRRFRSFSSIELGALLTATAVSLLLTIFGPIGWQHRRLDERTMLYATLAAGGMPLVYALPTACTKSSNNVTFEKIELRGLFQDQNTPDVP
jgi:hypothetical protein